MQLSYALNALKLSPQSYLIDTIVLMFRICTLKIAQITSIS
ncbi:hypothetical protein MCW_00707 [Cardidatus Bartonella washoeensis 085-0475]|uniref:Uncharacterized protein n=1 Tax=Cardidatus Bartonella washoeensis 085-0475 TaxID=1094564 RepID=J1JN41_9HYPH|nr:hypothetical protein MCW_00707 [Bartonella washoeensis 085-0475]